MIVIYFLANKDVVAVGDQTQHDAHVLHVTPVKDDDACAMRPPINRRKLIPRTQH